MFENLTNQHLCINIIILSFSSLYILYFFLCFRIFGHVYVYCPITFTFLTGPFSFFLSFYIHQIFLSLSLFFCLPYVFPVFYYILYTYSAVAIKIFLLNSRWCLTNRAPKAQIRVNKPPAAEEEDQSFGMLQSESRSNSYCNPKLCILLRVIYWKWETQISAVVINLVKVQWSTVRYIFITWTLTDISH